MRLRLIDKKSLLVKTMFWLFSLENPNLIELIILLNAEKMDITDTALKQLDKSLPKLKVSEQ